MTPSSYRALAATRDLLHFAAAGETAKPLAYVEALKLEPDEKKRSAGIMDAALTLATCGDPDTEAREIAAAYFTGPIEPDPRRKLDEDADDNAAGVAMAKHWTSGKARFLKPRDTDPAQAPAPGAPEPNPADRNKSTAPKSSREPDGRRSIDEVATAASVLAYAVELNLELSSAVTDAAAALRRLAKKITGDVVSKARILQASVRMVASVAAGGTLTIEDSTRIAEERDYASALIAKGAGVGEVEAAIRFSREHAELTRRGLTRIRRDDYIQTNLTAWRTATKT